MDRNNGFLNMENLIDYKNKHNKYIYQMQKGTAILEDGKKYFYKRTELFECFCELIASKIAKLLSVPCCDYDLVLIPKINGCDSGVISPYFKNNNCNYYSGKEIILDYYRGCLKQEPQMLIRKQNSIYNNLETIWNALEYRYRFCNNKREIVENLINGLRVQFCFDYIIKNTDRNFNNWEVCELGNKVELVQLFDHEDLWDQYDYVYPKFSVDGSLRTFDDELNFYFRVTCEEQIQDIIYLFDKYDKSLVEEAIMLVEEDIETEIPHIIKHKILNNYKKSNCKTLNFKNWRKNDF